MKRHFTRLKLYSVQVFTYFVFFGPSLAFSQTISTCFNSDFESGTFSGWQAETGTCCDITTTPSAIIPGRHTIVWGASTDPLACDNISIVAPGGNYSARLGNSSTGSEAEKLIYTYPVSSANDLFIYQYAVVLDDPGHPAPFQPRFEVKVTDGSGNLFNPTCGFYQVVANSGIPGFLTCDSVQYKNWTTIGMDMNALSGQSARIEFGTGDCGWGGHFGYAYIDAYCRPSQVTREFCKGDASAAFSAFPAFTYLWNTGEVTQNIVVSNPPDGYQATATMTSLPSCQIAQTTTLLEVEADADFSSQLLCYRTLSFTDLSRSVLVSSNLDSKTTLNSWYWKFGDGDTSTLQNPVHQYSTPGIYNINLTVTNTLGCSGTITKAIDVHELLIADFTSDTVCRRDPTSFKDLSYVEPGLNSVSWNWDFGDGLGFSSVENPSYVFTVDGIHQIQLIVTTNNGCIDTVTHPALVYPLPQVLFGDSVTGCYPLSVSFSDFSFITSGSIVSWDWDFGDGDHFSQPNPFHLYTTNITMPQPYDITLSLTSDKGCVDLHTFPSMVTMFPKPVANFSFTPVMETLMNPIISFFDESTWYGAVAASRWNFGDQDSSGLLNPQHTYRDTGVYVPQLMIKNQYGCMDTIIGPPVTIVPDYSFYIPNSFTPNTDGLNDKFSGEGVFFKDYSMDIYDRWGSLVFHTETMSSKWDGRVSGASNSIQDTYVYVIKIKDLIGKPHQFMGHVTLIK